MLSVLLVILFVAAAYVLLAQALARRVSPSKDVSLHAVTSSDGWRLDVAEFKGGDKGVVYLQHGLGASSMSFDLHPHGPSLARWLAARGYWVFAGNLRGRSSSAGGRADPAGTWNFSDYLLRDVPAIASFIAARTGRRFHWVGHSLGGILGLCHAARSGAALASVTTIGSALHYGMAPSLFARLLALRPLLERLSRVRVAAAHRLWGPVAALGLLPDGWHYNRRNIDARTALMFHAHGSLDMTVAELSELATTFSGEGILCEELARRLPALAERVPVPWLALGGSGDRQCPPEAVRWTFERVWAPEKELVLASRTAGFGADYGHFDLLCGARAPEEIWSRVAAFMERAESRPSS